MTTTAQSIIKQAHELLQDPDGIRWPATELVQHLNDGQRALVELHPEMFAITAPCTLVAGAKQTVPNDCAELIEVTRNTNGAALRVVERSMLDAIEPNWYSKTGTTALKHVCVDSRESAVFYVYPPAVIGASVELVYAAWPADVATPGGATAASVTGNVNCDDQFKNALLHFALFRAYAKDAEFGGNAALSTAHYALFKSGAGATAPAVAAKE